MNRYVIRLMNSIDCQLDAAIIEQPEGPDGDFYLSVRIADIVKHWEISAGDKILIEEA